VLISNNITEACIETGLSYCPNLEQYKISNQEQVTNWALISFTIAKQFIINKLLNFHFRRFLGMPGKINSNSLMHVKIHCFNIFCTRKLCFLLIKNDVCSMCVQFQILENVFQFYCAILSSLFYTC